MSENGLSQVQNRDLARDFCCKSVGGVPREQKILKGHLLNVLHDHVYEYTQNSNLECADTLVWSLASSSRRVNLLDGRAGADRWTHEHWSTFRRNTHRPSEDSCRANMAHIRQSRPDSGLGLGVQCTVHKPIQGVASSLGREGMQKYDKGVVSSLLLYDFQA